MNARYLPEGLPIPIPENDNLSKPYWDGLMQERLMVQCCKVCNTWIWGPEWICHACHSFELEWQEIDGKGQIYSWERPWHPVHSALKGFGPYLIVLVELPHVGNIRMIGNLLGNPDQEVEIGAQVEIAFEHHLEADPPHTLAQWKLI